MSLFSLSGRTKVNHQKQLVGPQFGDGTIGIYMANFPTWLSSTISFLPGIYLPAVYRPQKPKAASLCPVISPQIYGSSLNNTQAGV